MSGSGCLLPWLFGFIGKDSSFLLLGQLLVLSGEVRATGRAPPLCLTRPRVWTPGGRVALTGRLQVAADLWVTRPPAPSLAAGPGVAGWALRALASPASLFLPHRAALPVAPSVSFAE